jgi:hypothetical protein
MVTRRFYAVTLQAHAANGMIALLPIDGIEYEGCFAGVYATAVGRRPGNVHVDL